MSWRNVRTNTVTYVRTLISPSVLPAGADLESTQETDNVKNAGHATASMAMTLKQAVFRQLPIASGVASVTLALQSKQWEALATIAR